MRHLFAHHTAGKRLAAAAAGMTALNAQVAADNGAVTTAPLASPMSIDGDLGDWPPDSVAVPIDIVALRADDAVAASFRSCYDPEHGVLFVAVEVEDDDHAPVADGVSITEASAWLQHDSVAVYIDLAHAPVGSSPFYFVASGPRHEITPPRELRFDPATNPHWDGDIQIGFRREAARSTYEWSIEIGNAARPNATIGFDVLVVDQDFEGTPGRSVSSWGPQLAKSSAGGRLGDLVLLSDGQRPGRVNGQIQWDPASDPGYNWPGTPIRITSTQHPDLSVQVFKDDAYQFQVALPPGAYRATSPFPFDGEWYAARLAEGWEATFTVPDEAGAEVLLKWRSAPPPIATSRPQLIADFSPDDTIAFEQYVESMMRHYAIPGAAVAVVSQGELVYHGVFGVRNRVTLEPVTTKTLFEAGSVTKAIFALAANRLAARGEIDLHRPLHTYLPFPELEGDDRASLMTAHHVLTHQSGMPNWGRSLRAAPGAEYGYSGEAFEYLGRVLSQITNKSLAEIYRDEVLKPLGVEAGLMFERNAASAAASALGHVGGYPSSPRDDGRVGTAFGMFANAEALARVMIAMFDNRGLSEHAMNEMLRPQSHAAFRLPEVHWDVWSGLGFRILPGTPLGQAFGHGGSMTNGSECLFEAYPDERSGFIVLTNGNTGVPLYRGIRRFLVTGGMHLSEPAE